MAFPPKFRFAGAHLLLAVLTSLPAHAFISLNEGSDHLYATGTASLAYDSNIFAHAGGEGDYIYSAGLMMEYSRRAGLIGVNASVAINASRFGRNPTQDFNNPAFTAEFIKSGGRTTGTLKLLAARESQADVVAGIRTESWNYDAGFKFKYPVIERYSFSGNLDYIDRVYDQPTALTDLQTYTAGTDLLYALTSARDLVAGYQFRRSETSSASSFDDHSFTAGVSGRILAKLNGSLRAGYEVRSPRGATTDGAYRGLAASGSLTWSVSRTLTVNGQVSRDVSVTANNQSVNTTSGSLGLNYALRDNLSLTGTAGGGQSHFLDAIDAGRHDEYLTWGAGLKYKMNEHLDTSLNYIFDQNWSTFSYSDFTRHMITVSLSSRW
jgi:hypothetical protein